MTKISIVFKCLRKQKLLKNVFKMKNLRKINRFELKKISGGGFTFHDNGYEYNLSCGDVVDSIALCPQQQAVKCIQLEPGNAIGCGAGQNCINGACTGGFLPVK